jgi:hypothetical protein
VSVCSSRCLLHSSFSIVCFLESSGSLLPLLSATPGGIPSYSHQTIPLVINLLEELNLHLPSVKSTPSFSKHLLPELFYHISEYSYSSTLCLASSSVRAVTALILYNSMIVQTAAQLRPFLPAPVGLYFPLLSSFKGGAHAKHVIRSNLQSSPLNPFHRGGEQVTFDCPELPTRRERGRRRRMGWS